MSQKFRNYRFAASIVTVLVGLFVLLGCDPCRQFAEERCRCEPDEEKQKLCISRLSLAKEHHFFKVAEEPEVCLRALQKCTCPMIKNNLDAECGMYR